MRRWCKEMMDGSCADVTVKSEEKQTMQKAKNINEVNEQRDVVAG